MRGGALTVLVLLVPAFGLPAPAAALPLVETVPVWCGVSRVEVPVSTLTPIECTGDLAPDALVIAREGHLELVRGLRISPEPLRIGLCLETFCGGYFGALVNTATLSLSRNALADSIQVDVEAVVPPQRLLLVKAATPDFADRTPLAVQSWASGGSVHRLRAIQEDDPEDREADVAHTGAVSRIDVSMLSMGVAGGDARISVAGEATFRIRSYSVADSGEHVHLAGVDGAAAVTGTFGPVGDAATLDADLNGDASFTYRHTSPLSRYFDVEADSGTLVRADLAVPGFAMETVGGLGASAWWIGSLARFVITAEGFPTSVDATAEDLLTGVGQLHGRIARSGSSLVGHASPCTGTCTTPPLTIGCQGFDPPATPVSFRFCA